MSNTETDTKENINTNEKKYSRKASSSKTFEKECTLSIITPTAAAAEAEAPTDSIEIRANSSNTLVQLKESKRLVASTPKKSHKKSSTKDKNANASEDNGKDKESGQEQEHRKGRRSSSSSSSKSRSSSSRHHSNSSNSRRHHRGNSGTEEKESGEREKEDDDDEEIELVLCEEDFVVPENEESTISTAEYSNVEKQQAQESVEGTPATTAEEGGEAGKVLSAREVAAGRVVVRVLRSAVAHRKWHELVQEYVKSPASKSGRKRLCIIRELVSTERSYTSSLTTLINQYIFPLKAEAMKKSGLVSKDQLERIFANIEEINSLNTAMLRDLDTAVRGAPAGGLPIGATMLPHLRVFSMYSLYVNAYTAAAELLAKLRRASKPFAAFLQAASDRTAEPLDITSYLIMPVQRIPRYKLLLEDLVRHTDESNRDRDALIMCLAEVRALAEKINERRRLADSNAKIVEIQAHLTERIDLFQPARRFVREDRFAVEASARGLAAKSAPTLFLFNDSLLYVDKLESGKLRYRGFWPLTDVVLTENVPYTFAPADAVRMFILSCERLHRGHTELIVTADSAEAKASWVADFAENKAVQVDRVEKMRISAAAAEEGGAPITTTTTTTTAAAAAAHVSGSPIPLSTNNQQGVLSPGQSMSLSGRARSNTFSGRRGAPLITAAAVLGDSTVKGDLSSSPLDIPPPPLPQTPALAEKEMAGQNKNVDDQEVAMLRTPLGRGYGRRASEKIVALPRLCDDIPPPPLPSASSSVVAARRGANSASSSLNSSGGRNKSAITATTSSGRSASFSAASGAATTTATTSSAVLPASSASVLPVPVVVVAAPTAEHSENINNNNNSNIDTAASPELAELLREEATVVEEVRAEYRAAVDAAARLESVTRACVDEEARATAFTERSNALQKRIDEERRRLSALKDARSAAQKRNDAAKKALAAANERLLAAQEHATAQERQTVTLTARLHEATARRRQLEDGNALAEARAQSLAAETRALTARCERAEAAAAAATQGLESLRNAVAEAEAAAAREAERRAALRTEAERAQDAADELEARRRRAARERREAAEQRAQLAEDLAAAQAARARAEQGAEELEQAQLEAAGLLADAQAQAQVEAAALDTARAELRTLTGRVHDAQKERRVAEARAATALEGLAGVRRARAEQEALRHDALETRAALGIDMERARERCRAEHARCAAALAEVERWQAEAAALRAGTDAWSVALAQIKESAVVCREKVRQVEELAHTLGTYADSFARHRAQVEEAFAKLK